MSFGPIVSPEWLHEHVHDPDLRVVDFRWSLLGGSGQGEAIAANSIAPARKGRRLQPVCMKHLV